MGSKCSIGQQEKKTTLATNGTLSVVCGLNETKFDEEYQEGRQISTKVVEARNKITMRVDVAYKLPKNAMPCLSADMVVQRIHVLQGLEHPNICRLIEAFDDRSHIYLIYSKVQGEVLLKSIGQSKHLSERKVSNIAWQLARALCLGAACEPPVLHGALTPRNIILEKHGELIVTDLGIVDVLKPDSVHKVVSDDFLYMSPEVLEPWFRKQNQEVPDTPEPLSMHERCAEKTPACDVWSLGAILFQMLTGKPPFNGKDLKQIAEKVIKGDVNFEKKLSKVSAPGRSIVSKMLRKEPNQRPTWEQLLEHPWISSHRDNSNEPMDHDICENLISMHHETHFKKLVMRMVSEKLPRNQVKKLKEEFQKLDLNGDGMITLEELKQGVLTNPAFADRGPALEAAFKEVDSDQNGKMSVNEFVASTLDSQNLLVQQALWDAFKAIDANHDGKLSKKELNRMVHEMGNRLGPEHIDEMSRLVQHEVKDGISFDEFCELMNEEGTRLEHKANGMCYKVMQGCERCQVRTLKTANAAVVAVSPRKPSPRPQGRRLSKGAAPKAN